MELEFIIGKRLAKEADSRYQNAGDLAVDLKNLQEKLKSGRSVHLKTSVGAGTEASVGARRGAVSGAESAVRVGARLTMSLNRRNSGNGGLMRVGY